MLAASCVFRDAAAGVGGAHALPPHSRQSLDSHDRESFMNV